MMKARLALTLLAVLLVAAASADADPIIVQFKVGGVAQVVRTASGGYVGGLQSSNQLGYNTDTDRIHVADTSNGGYSLFWLDPEVYGDVGGSHDSRTGAARNWGTSASTGDVYAGTVTGGVRQAMGSYGTGFAYVPETGSMFVKSGGGNNAAIHEYQAARTDGGSDVVGEGTVGDQTNSARLLSLASPTLTTGEFHVGLAYLGSDGDSLNFLFIDSSGGTSNHGAFFSLAAPRTTEPTATTAGTRSLTDLVEAGAVVSSTDLGNLVPGVGDTIRDITNDLSGQIWALSTSGTDTYLSAFTLVGNALTQVDLDPDSANLHVQLLGITDTDGVTPTAGYGLAVNGDASKIYVLANGTGKDHIFIYDNLAAVPEPATLALLALGGLALGAARIRRRRI